MVFDEALHHRCILIANSQHRLIPRIPRAEGTDDEGRHDDTTPAAVGSLLGASIWRFSSPGVLENGPAVFKKYRDIANDDTFGGLVPDHHEIRS